MFEEVINIIQQVANDRSVPKNIRTRCEESIAVLKDEKEDAAVRIKNAGLEHCLDNGKHAEIAIYISRYN